MTIYVDATRGFYSQGTFLDVGKFIWFIYSNNPLAGFQPLINLRGWVKWAAFLSVKITNESLITHTRLLRGIFFLKFDILFLYGSVKVFYEERDYKKHATLCEQYTSWHKMKFSVRKMSTGGSTMMIDLVVISVRLLMLLLPLDAVAGFLN